MEILAFEKSTVCISFINIRKAWFNMQYKA